MSRSAEHWIRVLALEPHPEGGWFRETWRSPERSSAASLPERFGADRSLSTAIYYLLQAGAHSCLHRLRADEVWHLYEGGPLVLHVIDPQGEYRPLVLGTRIEAGESPQQVVPHGSWFGAETAPGAPYALVGCTVAPGFDFADFELADRAALRARFPRHDALILRLTPDERT